MILALTLVPGVPPAKVALAQSHIGVSITPQQTTVGFNENFNVTIWIDDSLGESYDGVAIRLVYNTSYVTATNVTDADTFDFVLDNGTINNTWNATHGLVKYDAANISGLLNTSNPVCTVNFRSNGNAGISGLDFIYIAADTATSVTSRGADILNWTYVVNGTVEVVGPALMVDVSPAGKGDVKVAGVTPSSYPNTTSWSWDENVALEAVNSTPGWGFVNWSGDLGGSTNPINITMSGNYSIRANFEAAGPAISIIPTAKNFGNITVGSSSSPQTFNVSNVGNANLTVGTINITGTNATQFAIQNDNVSNKTIIANGSATLQVVFTPTSTGAKSATLNIPSNDPDEATVLVSLSGSGVTEGAVIPPTPANFSVTSLNLSSEQVEPGQEVLVTVNVTNIGGSEGSYALNLTINGAVEQTKTVTLAPLASDTVTFTVIKEEPGSYTISVDGLTKEFIVAAPSWVSRYWWTVLAAIVIIGLVVSFLWSRRRVRA